MNSIYHSVSPQVAQKTRRMYTRGRHSIQRLALMCRVAKKPAANDEGGAFTPPHAVHHPGYRFPAYLIRPPSMQVGTAVHNRGCAPRDPGEIQDGRHIPFRIKKRPERPLPSISGQGVVRRRMPGARQLQEIVGLLIEHRKQVIREMEQRKRRIRIGNVPFDDPPP